jgi:hypothetical protein
MISGTLYEWMARMTFCSYGNRSAVVLNSTTDSSSFTNFPSHQYSERTPGKTVAQAAACDSTTALEIFSASSCDPAVTNTIRT